MTTKHYDQIFDYLSAPELPEQPEDAVVFGRKDPLVAHAVGDLAIANLVDIAVITGGIGKDSGDIREQGYDSEASYLHAQLAKDAQHRRYSVPSVLLDPAASNGGENARNSLLLLREQNHTGEKVTAVAHATSARRLAELWKHETRAAGVEDPIAYVKPTAYSFDASNPMDRAEATAELLRLADWPAKGWLGEQSDLPEDLVEFARDQQSK